jgi:hypothetical protein
MVPIQAEGRVGFYLTPTKQMSCNECQSNRQTFRQLRTLVSYKDVRFEIFTAVTMKNGVFWDVTPCGSCKNRSFGELSDSFISVTRIDELGTTLAACVGC